MELCYSSKQDVVETIVGQGKQISACRGKLIRIPDIVSHTNAESMRAMEAAHQLPGGLQGRLKVRVMRE
jgi:hypothetical protein